jgi:histone H1/5
MTSEKSGQDGPKNPPYLDMVLAAIKADASRTGTSKQAILKYISEHYNLDAEKANGCVKTALKKGVDTNKLKMAKESGKGANSYKLGEKPKKEKAASSGDTAKPVVVKKPIKTAKLTVKPPKVASEKAKKPPAAQKAKKVQAVNPDGEKTEAAQKESAANVKKPVAKAKKEPPATKIKDSSNKADDNTEIADVKVKTTTAKPVPAKKPKVGAKKAAVPAESSADETAEVGSSKGGKAKASRKPARRPPVTDSGSAIED